MQDSRPSSPTRSRMIMRGVVGACAVCGKWRMSRRWLSVSPNCERCEFPIERQQGHFVGAVGINTMVTFTLILVAFLLSILLSGNDFSPGRVILILLPLVIVFAIGFFPISKTLWSAMELTMVPLEPGEVDPRFDPTISLESEGT